MSPPAVFQLGSRLLRPIGVNRKVNNKKKIILFILKKNKNLQIQTGWYKAASIVWVNTDVGVGKEIQEIQMFWFYAHEAAANTA